MTPCELGFHFEAYNEKTKQAERDRISLTYLGAWLGRIKNMPSLNELLGNEVKIPQQDPEDMLRVIKSMNASMGGEVI